MVHFSGRATCIVCPSGIQQRSFDQLFLSVDAQQQDHLARLIVTAVTTDHLERFIFLSAAHPRSAAAIKRGHIAGIKVLKDGGQREREQ